MKHLKTKYFGVALLLLSSEAVNAQQIISLENDLKDAQSQVERVKQDILNHEDYFVSSGPGTLQNQIEGQKGKSSLYMSSVTITGKINFADLHYLASISSIEKLDIYGAFIIGDKIRSNDVYPSNVYQGNDIGLKEIVLPKTLVGIDHSAFQNLSSLKRIIIPSGCRVIGEAAFSNTDSLKVISLPHSLLFIEDNAFSRSGIEVMILPSGIKSVGKSAFRASRLKYFSSEKVKECFFVSDSLLADCPDLEFAAFHKKVRVFGKGVVLNTPNLKELKFDSPLPPYLLDKSIKRLSKNLVLRVPDASLTYYKKKAQWRRLKNCIVAASQTNKVNIDSLYDKMMASSSGRSLVTRYNVVDPAIKNEIQVVDLLKNAGLGETITSHAPSSKKGLPVSDSPANVSPKPEVSTPPVKVPVENQKEKSKSSTSPMQTNNAAHLTPVVSSSDSIPSNIETIVAQSNPVKIQEEIEEVTIDQILPATPAKVYWLTGKLYVEATKAIKVANLMTMDGLYIYGKAESETLWSFRIDASHVSSVRISYVGSDVPEIIKMR